MKHYLLIYETAPDYFERRAQYRDAHLAKAWAAAERGDVVLAGALEESEGRAVLLFLGKSPEAAQRFAEDDPYVKSGIVQSWRVVEWLTVVGASAANPVRAS
jgi:uncharacterized protein YciI